MSDYYLGNYQGDFEDQEDLIWNEFDWQKYLSRNKCEIYRLIDFYKSVRYDRGGYLEKICKFMNWGNFDIFGLQDSEIEESSDIANAILQEESDEDSQIEVEAEPYTIHKNPLYCFSMAIYQFIQDQCEELLANGKAFVSPIDVWRFSKSLLAGQSNLQMAVFSIDLGDTILAICHLKYVFQAINESFLILKAMPNTVAPVKEIYLALFIFREVLLRVLKDCRQYDKGELGETE